jgi:hypothetical protein
LLSEIVLFGKKQGRAFSGGDSLFLCGGLFSQMTINSEIFVFTKQSSPAALFPWHLHSLGA